MRKAFIPTMFCVFVLGCASNAITNFGIKIDPMEGVDPAVARKIALNWMLSRKIQEGGIKISIFYRDEKEMKECFNNPRKEFLGKYCGAKYLIITEYIKYVGLEAYYVMENFENSTCEYLFSEDFGLQE